MGRRLGPIQPATNAKPAKPPFFRLRGQSIEVFGRTVRLPASRAGRTALGGAAVVGGLFSFLPVLGIWMLPLGIVILSIDFPKIRKARRRFSVRWERRRRGKAAGAPRRPQSGS